MTQPILTDEAFVAELSAIAGAGQRSLDEVRAAAERALDEMQGKRSALAVRAFAALSRFVYRRGYPDAPIYDLGEVEKVRHETAARSVVFLVTHKTYLDFFVLFDFLYRQGIPTPYIFGGLNMNFAGFGALARRAGGIFIRRSFREDEIYKAVLRQYIRSLIRSGACFMWAIEGTRSRTGKLVIPRLGLLNYVGGISRSLGDEAVAYIPVSVTYDQIPDVIDMAAEEAGAAKSPESLGWFMRYVRGMGGPFGDIHIRFGDAMSPTDTPDAPDLESSRGIVDESQIRIQKLAFEACYRINEITPATTPSLVLMALLCRGRGSPEQVSRDVAELVAHIHAMEGRMLSRHPSRAPATDPVAAIRRLRSTGIVRLAGPDGLLEIEPERVSVAIYYSNMAVHHFVVRAVVELALMLLASDRRLPGTGNNDSDQPAEPAQFGETTQPSGLTEPAAPVEMRRELAAGAPADGTRGSRMAGDGAEGEGAAVGSAAGESADQFWAACRQLRDLFKFEFFFSRRDVFQQQIEEELALLHPQWQQLLSTRGHRIPAVLGQQPLRVAPGVLLPFVVSYRQVAEMLVEQPETGALTDEEFVSQCLTSFHQRPEPADAGATPGVSRALLVNGLRVVDSRGLRAAGPGASTDPGESGQPGDPVGPGAARQQFLAELDRVAQALAELRSLPDRPGNCPDLNGR